MPDCWVQEGLIEYGYNPRLTRMVNPAITGPAIAMTRSVGFSHSSGPFRVNCQVTAAAESTSMTESSPNPMSTADEAASTEFAVGKGFGLSSFREL